eukprot:c27492_g1_i1 orf=430-2484(+)
MQIPSIPARLKTMCLVTSGRRRKILLTTIALVAAGYASYRLYKSTALSYRRRQLLRTFKSLSFLAKAVSESAESVSIVSDDLKTFLRTDGDEVPHSLRQALKVVQCPEFKEAVVVFCAALTQGVLQGLNGNGEKDMADSKLYGSKGIHGIESGSENTNLNSDKVEIKSETEKDPVNSALDGAYVETREVQFVKNNCHVEPTDKVTRVQVGHQFICHKKSIFDDWEEEKSEPDVFDGQKQQTQGRLSGGNLNGLTSVAGWIPRNNWTGKLGFMAYKERHSRGWGRDGWHAEGFFERFLDKLFTESGVGFVSVVAGNVARNLVVTLLQELTKDLQRNEGTLRNGFVESSRDTNSRKKGQFGSADKCFSSQTSARQNGNLNIIFSDKCRSLIAECIQNFVSTAVSVYIDKTKDINFYDDMVEGIVNPSHHAVMKELITSVCNGAVETLVRTSHDVMFKKGSTQPESSSVQQDKGMQVGKLETLNGEPCVISDEMPIMSEVGCRPSIQNCLQEFEDSGINVLHDELESPKIVSDLFPVSGSGISYKLVDHVASKSGISLVEEGTSHSSQEVCAGSLSSILMNGSQNMQKWVDSMSKTLAIPSNRKLVLDLAGTMTSEAVRSFFEVMMATVSSYLWDKVASGVEKGKNQLQQGSRYILDDARVKFISLATVFLVICLHVLIGVHVLEPT